jgi:hypothetical protein
MTVLLIGAATISGCATPAPGAKEVKITGNPNDVAACTPVGNIDTGTMNNWDRVVAQNKAVGYNGNVILDTGVGGIAYRCGKTSTQ